MESGFFLFEDPLLHQLEIYELCTKGLKKRKISPKKWTTGIKDDLDSESIELIEKMNRSIEVLKSHDIDPSDTAIRQQLMQRIDELEKQKIKLQALNYRYRDLKRIEKAAEIAKEKNRNHKTVL